MRFPSSVNDDGSAAAAAGSGFADHRRSRNGGSTGEVVVVDGGRGGGGGGRGGNNNISQSPPPFKNSTAMKKKKKMDGIPSPRGKRKDVLIYSYTMHQMQLQHQQPSQGGKLRSSLFNSLRRRSNEENDNAKNGGDKNTMDHELSSSGGEQRQVDSRWGNENISSNIIKENSGTGSIHPSWTLPSYIRLAPRMDVWSSLTVSSCAAVASIGQTFASSNNNPNDNSSFSNWDILALSTCALTFLSSLVIAIGVRYTPFRQSVTKSFFWSDIQGRSPSRLLSLLTMEFMVLTVLTILWMFSMPVIVNGNAFYNSTMNGSFWGVPLAVAGYEIWNANLFYSSWISSILCGYLWIEVFTLHDRGGTTLIALPEDVDRDSRVVAAPGNAFTKRWLFLMCTALILMSSSISTYTSPVCQGKVLKSTSYCQLALMGIILGGVFQLLITLCVGLLYQLSHMRRGSKIDNDTESTTRLSSRKRDLFTSIAAVISLIVQITNTAVLTSPSGGGPGSISGTLYFACWMGFVLSFELCLRYLDEYSTAPSDDSILNDVRSTTEEDVTVYEDNDAEDSDRVDGMNSSDEEKANYRMGTNSPIQKDTNVDNSQFFVPPPSPLGRRSPSPVTIIKKVEHGRREPSVASSTDRSDPDDHFSQATPSFNDSSPSMDPEGALGNSYFTSISMNSRTKDDFVTKHYKKRVPTTRMKEPEAMNLAPQIKISLSKKKQDIDDVQAGAQMRRLASSSTSPSSSMKRKNLSPLVEGNTEETSPYEDNSPETILGTFSATRQVKSTGRMTPSLRNDARLGQQQKVDKTRISKSGTSSRSSRSRSRENAVRSSHAISSVGGSRSRHSITPPQQMNAPLVSALSGSQRYSRSGSGGQSKSSKTVSSRAVEGSNSSPEDSASNPPPTISGETSSEEDMPDDANNKIFSTNEYRGPPPPPPPFQSPRVNSPPMQSIRTSMEGQGETDSIVSEPTLDAGLEDSIGTPSPKPTRPSPVLKSNSNNNDSQHHHHQSGSSVTSYEKKDSDDTNLLTRVNSQSSDENISSNEGQTGIKVVDDIVAAALAYAEMTHGAATASRGTAARRGSGATTPASSQQHPIASTPQSSHRKTPSKGGSKKQHKEARSIATSGGSSSSLHSYYSKKRGGQRNSASSGYPPSTTPAEDLLVKALSQARSYGHGHMEQNQHQQRRSIKSGISVESVYSEEETENSTRVDYDC